MSTQSRIEGFFLPAAGATAAKDGGGSTAVAGQSPATKTADGNECDTEMEERADDEIGPWAYPTQEQRRILETMSVYHPLVWVPEAEMSSTLPRFQRNLADAFRDHLFRQSDFRYQRDTLRTPAELDKTNTSSFRVGPAGGVSIGDIRTHPARSELHPLCPHVYTRPTTPGGVLRLELETATRPHLPGLHHYQERPTILVYGHGQPAPDPIPFDALVTELWHGAPGEGATGCFKGLFKMGGKSEKCDYESVAISSRWKPHRQLLQRAKEMGLYDFVKPVLARADAEGVVLTIHDPLRVRRSTALTRAVDFEDSNNNQLYFQAEEVAEGKVTKVFSACTPHGDDSDMMKLLKGGDLEDLPRHQAEEFQGEKALLCRIVAQLQCEALIEIGEADGEGKHKWVLVRAGEAMVFQGWTGRLCVHRVWVTQANQRRITFIMNLWLKNQDAYDTAVVNKVLGGLSV